MKKTVPVAGREGAGVSVVLSMFDGFNDLLHDADALIEKALRLGPGTHLVAGSLSNPYFVWPVFATVKGAK